MRFVDAIRQSAQDPFGASIHFLDDLGYLYDGDAYVFSALAHGDEDRLPDFRQALFRDDPYTATELSWYEELPDDGKAAVLGFETVLLHEVTHQIDTLMTPVGALLHTWQIEEFLRLVPVLLFLGTEPDLDISAPLARSATTADHPVREALRRHGQLESLEELLAYTAEFRVFDGIAASDVTVGWSGGRRSVIAFFGESLEPVMLFDETFTVRRTAANDPVTIQTVLETRALANCLRHILWRFRDDPVVGAREMKRYLACFYPPSADDYRLVFDALARLFGFADLPSALDGLARTPVESLDQLPVLAGLVGWIALHGADTTERLLLSAEFLRTSIQNGVHFDSPSDILNRYDAEQASGPRADRALEDGRQLVRNQRDRIPPHPEGLTAHFAHVLDTVDRQLTLRIDRALGLGDPVGTPNFGNPAQYLTAAQADDIGGSYYPDPAYDQWRQLRTLLLARRRPSARKHAAIDAWFATVV